MERSRWVAIMTGIVAVLLGIGYLVLVQLLDFRGDLLPAPVEILETIATLWSHPPTHPNLSVIVERVDLGI